MGKEKKPVMEHWPDLVKAAHDFYEKNFEGEKLSFDGSAPRDLKMICEALKKRAIEAGVEWTSENACRRLLKFLDAANKVPWLHENFLLFNLNRQKDKIFYNLKKQSNGTAYFRSPQEKPVATINPTGSFGKL